MNLYAMLASRAEAGNPIRVGLIGAGKFGSMFLAQARLTPGIHIVGIADLDVPRARSAVLGASWPETQIAVEGLDDAVRSGRTAITEDAAALIGFGALDVVVEATGDPGAGVRHCLAAIENGKHVVMVTVEADVVAGPLLARRAEAAGVVYSLAWGDQPALVCEHVDWARACGFKVVCAGKGTRYHPSYHASTPDTVWDILDQYLNFENRDSINPKMFNSFVDGSKSAIEMSAVCNATGLVPQPQGLGFPPASRFELAEVCKPAAAAGRLARDATTEVVSSVRRDLSEVEHHLALGTFVVVETESDYVRRCFREYAMLPDRSGAYAALYRPIHMIGLELGISVASLGCRGEPTGRPREWLADVVATAKRALKNGELLDGEGGFMVWGKQVPARRSLEIGGLPLGLAGAVRLTRDIAEGAQLTTGDVALDEHDAAVKLRREMVSAFAGPGAGEGDRRTHRAAE